MQFVLYPALYSTAEDQMTFSNKTSAAKVRIETSKIKGSHQASLTSKSRGHDNSPSIGRHSSTKKSGVNYDEDTDDVKDVEASQKNLLKRSLASFPVRANRTTGRLKQPLTHAPRTGGFRVKHGFQVRKIYSVLSSEKQKET